MEAEAFERLYAAHAEALLRFLVFRVGDRAAAEDIVADTFERVLRTRRRFDPRRGSERTWVYTIALNLLRDGARRTAAQGRALERVGAARIAEEGRALGLAETRGDLLRALEALSVEEREAVSLRFGADLTLPEIARVIRKPESTVQGRLYRAIGKLHEHLE